MEPEYEIEVRCERMPQRAKMWQTTTRLKQKNEKQMKCAALLAVDIVRVALRHPKKEN